MNKSRLCDIEKEYTLEEIGKMVRDSKEGVTGFGYVDTTGRYVPKKLIGFGSDDGRDRFLFEDLRRTDKCYSYLPVIKPTVHLNGDSVKTLFEEHEKAMMALTEALESLPRPNQRNFYVQSEEAYDKALGQLIGWRKSIQSVLEDITEITSDLQKQLK
jgi:hypothetical protein